MVAILVIAALFLGIVVLYNLGVISFHERIRELSTLKVLGFDYNKIRKLVQMQNIWITIIGSCIGLVAGYILLDYMMKFMGGNFDFSPKVRLISYIGSFIGTLLVSMQINKMLSIKIKKIDMVSALKSVE